MSGPPAKKAKWTPPVRKGPSAPGSKPIPEGEPNCLVGLTFVFTGELSSLERSEAQDLVKRYGGRVTTAPSSKTSYVVLGEDAGPKKLETIKKNKLKTLDEDGFLDLIGSRRSSQADPKVLEQKKEQLQAAKANAKTLVDPKDAENEDIEGMMWVDKYKPRKLNDLCGNKASYEKIYRWLENWPKDPARSKFNKPGPDGTGTYRGLLISGPPGIGKTSGVLLIAKLLGYNVYELNASDTRSKRLVADVVAEAADNETISFGPKKFQNHQKSLIVMDEVDGMSAGDRGGVGALTALIRKSLVPIIAICNDATSPKMKPFEGTCYRMTLRRPDANAVRSRILSIAYKENIQLDGTVVDSLTQATRSDLRQLITLLSTYKLSANSMSYDESKAYTKQAEKNMIHTPWTLYDELTGPGAFSAANKKTFNDKLDLYYMDHDMLPLFVQESYLKKYYARASRGNDPLSQLEQLNIASETADAISDGDLAGARIHSNQEWSLMPIHGMFSCVRPAFYCYGANTSFVGFPQYLGKLSSRNRMYRLLSDIQIKLRLNTSCSIQETRLTFIPYLVDIIMEKIGSPDAISDIIDLLDAYYFTKEDYDALMELIVDPAGGDAPQIPSKMKSAFTRQYNARSHPVAIHKTDQAAPQKLSSRADDIPDNEDVLVDEPEPEDIKEDVSSVDPLKDSFIKAKAPGGTKPKKTPAPAKRASTTTKKTPANKKK